MKFGELSLSTSNVHTTSDAQLHFNTSPLNIDKEALKAIIGGLGDDAIRDQALDGIWESLVERVQHSMQARKKADEVSLMLPKRCVQ